ncbi:MAG: 3-hydroxyacyl-CoA dehydrogenase family protein, partial [Pseudomonas sp.]
KYIEPELRRAEVLFRKKRLNSAEVKSAMARLQPDLEGSMVSLADVVIEVIIEKLEAKQQLLRELEPRLKEGAILATNTSSIPLEQIATALEQPERLIGLHFFNPVAKMPLVEVVRGELSDADTLLRGAAFCGQIKRYPLPVRSSPGFLVNRVLAPYMLEALIIHSEGVALETIDAAAESFGMPMGPIELADTVGLDVCQMVMNTLGQEAAAAVTPAREAAGSRIRELVDKGYLGRKTGRGLYIWEQDKAIKNGPTGTASEQQHISDRLMGVYINECHAALADGIVTDADLLDAGMIFGTGFPPFRGGPLFYQRKQEIDPQRQQAASEAAS